MIRFTFSPAAQRDMAQIWLYTADRWGIEQADRYVKQIESDLVSAADGSPLVRPLDGYFRIKSGSHLCIFRKGELGRIAVVRVLHGRMDAGAHLR